MKNGSRRILILMLAVLMAVMSLFVMTIGAAAGPQESGETPPDSQESGETPPEPEIIALPAAGGALVGDYYVPEGGLDVTAPISVAAGESASIDLMGQTLTISAGSFDNNANAITNAGTLVIKDTEGEGKINISAELTANGKTFTGIYNTGSLTVSDGIINVSISQASGYYYITGVCCDGESASFTHTGGEISLTDPAGSKNYAVWLKEGADYALSGGKVSMNGNVGSANYTVYQQNGDISAALWAVNTA